MQRVKNQDTASCGDQRQIWRLIKSILANGTWRIETFCFLSLGASNVSTGTWIPSGLEPAQPSRVAQNDKNPMISVVASDLMSSKSSYPLLWTGKSQKSFARGLSWVSVLRSRCNMYACWSWTSWWWLVKQTLGLRLYSMSSEKTCVLNKRYFFLLLSSKLLISVRDETK